MDVYTAISKRYSCRQFNDVALTAAQVQQLKEAAQAAPTARNMQELRFSFVSDRALLQAISDACISAKPELSELLASRSAENIFYGAPTAIIITAKPVKYAFLDAGIAVQNLALTATAAGLGSCIIGLAAAAFADPEDRTFYRAIGAGEAEVFQIAIAVGQAAMTKEPHVAEQEQVRFV